MRNLPHRCHASVLCYVVVVALGAAAALGEGGVRRAADLVDAGNYDEAIKMLVAELDENPADQAARMLLADAYEKAGMDDKASSAWKDLMLISDHEGNLRKARRALSRLRRRKLDAIDVKALDRRAHQDDPFDIPMPEIDWKGLEVVEDTKFLPPIPEHPFPVPPFVEETEHFTVYTPNERLSKVVGERAEAYLQFMADRLFGGESWAVRFPIIVYSTYDEYVSHGARQGTAGVTFGHATGKTQKILIHQLQPPTRDKKNRGSGKEIWKYAIESVLPHELTHAVINEFFGGQKTPQWLHEAVAGRFELTREHYQEAARLARAVVAGEHFRMRDLFEQEGYPARISLFYEQAAIVVLYLFEAGPEAMHTFLGELAAGHDHDDACAAVLGIPKEGAVEEFEKRWVEWMQARYIKDLEDPAYDAVLDAKTSDNPVFRPWVNELDTVASIDTWRDIPLTSLDGFVGVGESMADWSTNGGKLRCRATGDKGASMLGMRMNETAPVAVTCDVRFVGNPGDEHRWFGFAQLDADNHDTTVQVTAPFNDGREHPVVALWLDDLAMYVDGKCVGRYPAFFVTGNQRDIDFPLALTAEGPFEVQNLRVGAIDEFSDKPVVEEDKDKGGKKRKRSRPQRRRRSRGGSGPIG